MRKKSLFKMIAFTILMVGCSNKAELYTMKIDVTSKQENGKEWDIMGGAPD